MTDRPMLRSLAAMVAIQDGRVERLSREMHTQQQACSRYRDHIDLLQQLGSSSAECVDRRAAVLALNYAQYRQAIGRVVAEHRERLASQEQTVAAARRQLVAGAVQRDGWRQTRSSHEAEFAREEARREQQRQDDRASLAWLHARR